MSNERKEINKEKLKALEVTLGKIEKDFGKGTIMKLGDDAIEDIKAGRVGEIPSYLKDSTSNRLKAKHSGEISDSAEYKYPHNYEGNYVEQQYLPKQLISKKYYNPSENGYEKLIKANLSNLKRS